ncbi:MAG: hypothetical protein JXR77_07475, partial [Lentisphaeria bacterium]|nr:hypothetical protein [Lentisphaeria bacterium]
GESLAAGNIRRPVARAGLPREWADWLACAADLETRYFEGMRRFLREDLGVRCPIAGTQISYGGAYGMLREAAMDYTDMHAYWQHPRFPGKPWDPNNWRVSPQSMAAAEGGTLLRLATQRMIDQPFMVSEFNHPHPNPHAAECWPMTASFAALQDWDGLVIHNYLNYSWEEWTARRRVSFFDTASSPQKAVFLPAAAILFRTAGIPPLAPEAILEIPRDTILPDLAAGRGGDDLWKSRQWGFPELMTARMGRRLLPAGAELALRRTAAPPSPSAAGPPTASWETGEDQRLLYQVSSPLAVVVAGAVCGRTVTCGPLTMTLRPGRTGSAVVALVALDRQPLPTSGNLLLAIGADAANSGAVPSHGGESLADWGTEPVLAEVISGRIALTRTGPALEARALDGQGRPAARLPLELLPGSITLDIPPEADTIWYLLHATDSP